MPVKFEEATHAFVWFARGAMTIPVLTRSYNNARSGTDEQETVLTPDAVETRGQQKLFSLVGSGKDGSPLFWRSPDPTPNADGTPRLRLLWDSQRLPGNTFNHNKFGVPVVSGGKVYVPRYDGRIDVYGLA